MEADIRKFKPLREGVRDGLTTLLVQARQIWGDDTDDYLTLDQIVVRLIVDVGDIARVLRDNPTLQNYGVEGDADAEKIPSELKKELGNVIFSTIRWIDDLGLDVLECLDLAIEAQEKFVKSGRPR